MLTHNKSSLKLVCGLLITLCITVLLKDTINYKPAFGKYNNTTEQGEGFKPEETLTPFEPSPTATPTVPLLPSLTIFPFEPCLANCMYLPTIHFNITSGEEPRQINANANVSFSLYVDGNSNGQMDYSGADVCVLSELNNGMGDLLSWLANQVSIPADWIIQSGAFHTDFTINTFDKWWDCARDYARELAIPNNQYYNLHGCSPYQDYLWVGSTSGSQRLVLSHRTNALEPC